MLIALCQSTYSCSCRCSTTIMKRMKQATLFGFFCSKYVLSEWLICISSNTWFTRMVCSSKSESVLKQKMLWRLQTQGRWLATQSTPWISPCHSNSGTRKRDSELCFCSFFLTQLLCGCIWLLTTLRGVLWKFDSHVTFVRRGFSMWYRPNSSLVPRPLSDFLHGCKIKSADLGGAWGRGYVRNDNVWFCINVATWLNLISWTTLPYSYTSVKYNIIY